MTTIKLPPLPKDMLHTILKLCDEYATAAIELDRAQRGEPAASQYPVAWRYVPSKYFEDYVFTDDARKADAARSFGLIVDPLYTAPQSAHTEEDVQEILGSALREFGVFEQTARDVLGVPKP